MGALFVIAGAALLLPVSPSSALWQLALPCFVMGIGFGYVASPGVIVAQSSVGWEHRGVSTGTNMFSRSIGSAVGVAVFGAIVNSRVAGGCIGRPAPRSRAPVGRRTGDGDPHGLRLLRGRGAGAAGVGIADAALRGDGGETSEPPEVEATTIGAPPSEPPPASPPPASLPASPKPPNIIPPMNIHDIGPKAPK